MEEGNNKIQNDLNQQTVYTQNKPKIKKIVALIMIVISLILIVIGIVLFILGGNEKAPTKKEEVDQEEILDGEKELIDKKAKAEIDKFYKVIEGSTDYIKYHFAAGDSITNSNEIYVAIHSLFDNNKFTKLESDKLPSKYTNDANYKQNVDKGCIIKISFDDIEKEFNSMFGSKPSFDSKELTAVNDLLCLGEEESFDEELKLLLFNKCACSEGKSSNTLYMSKYKYTYDDDNYYLYLHATWGINSEYYTLSTNSKVDADSFEGNESKFELFKWTFNKNYKFIKAEITSNFNDNNQ
jgi:hypothetical protein